MARVPERYGTLLGADGKAYGPGQLAPMDARMLKAYGVSPEPKATAPAPAPASVKGK